MDPEFVFVTGWNEWIAQRFLNEGGTSMLGRKLAKGETFFVDQYSQEYSRDRGYGMASGSRRERTSRSVMVIHAYGLSHNKSF